MIVAILLYMEAQCCANTLCAYMSSRRIPLNYSKKSHTYEVVKIYLYSEVWIAFTNVESEEVSFSPDPLVTGFFLRIKASKVNENHYLWCDLRTQRRQVQLILSKT